MGHFDVAVVGTGPPPDGSDSHEGYSMGYRHARSYRTLSNCTVSACADVRRESAEAFAAEFDVDEGAVYTDHELMLAEAAPDVVSVCTPPATHPEIVLDCADAAVVRAIHCEKPLAPTWSESERMVEACARRGVQLTINLQNRCSDAVRAAKRSIDVGEIGALERIELSRADLLQTGIHEIDVCNYLNDDRRVDWVMGQIDYPAENRWYTDTHSEAQAFTRWRYENGLDAVLATGTDADLIDGHVRIVGADGTIELHHWDEPAIRIRTAGPARGSRSTAASRRPRTTRSNTSSTASRPAPTRR